LSRSRERRNLSSTHGRTLRHAFIRLSIGTRNGIFTTTTSCTLRRPCREEAPSLEDQLPTHPHV
jgi:hypothetical protein